MTGRRFISTRLVAGETCLRPDRYRQTELIARRRIREGRRNPCKDASRDRRAGECVEKVVRGCARRRGCFRYSLGKSVGDKQAPAQRKARSAGMPFDLLGFGQRPVAVEPPERDLWVNLENAVGQLRSVTQRCVDLADFWSDHEKLSGHFFRRVRCFQCQPASVAVVLRIDRPARRHRENRRLPIAQKRPHGAFRPSPLRSDMVWKSDGHVHRNNARLLGRCENIRELSEQANPNVLVVRPDERRDPPGPAAVHPRDPLRLHGAFTSPLCR
jgi:hypothetical protein